MWRIKSLSNIGKRKTNQDYILHESIKKNKRIIDVLILCDGIGEFQKSDLCSKLVCTHSMSIILNFIRKTKTKKSIKISDFKKLIPLLHNLNITEIQENAGTTFTAAIIDRKKTSNGITIFYLWAGDSRIYIKKNDANLELLTKDHVDNKNIDKPIICSFDETGQICGNIDFGIINIKGFKYIALTSDGIHDKCKKNELEEFLEYNFALNKISNKILESNLTYFLGKNISDNYSLILQYYKQ